jgi:hypothetical protein
VSAAEPVVKPKVAKKTHATKEKAVSFHKNAGGAKLSVRTTQSGYYITPSPPGGSFLWVCKREVQRFREAMLCPS